MAKDRRSRDQKRKDKLAKKQQRLHEQGTLAYTGQMYRKTRLVPTWLATEKGMYEAFVVSRQRVTDRSVESALIRLIQMLRAGPLPPYEEKSDESGITIPYQVGQEDDLVIDRIRSRWVELFEKESKPSRDDLIGVLRTMLGTLQSMTTGEPQSQTYLRFIIRFLREKAGILISIEPAERQASDESSPDEAAKIESDDASEPKG